jgi:hypothetical protein
MWIILDKDRFRDGNNADLGDVDKIVNKIYFTKLRKGYDI